MAGGLWCTVVLVQGRDPLGGLLYSRVPSTGVDRFLVSEKCSHFSSFHLRHLHAFVASIIFQMSRSVVAVVGVVDEIWGRALMSAIVHEVRGIPGVLSCLGCRYLLDVASGCWGVVSCSHFCCIVSTGYGQQG